MQVRTSDSPGTAHLADGLASGDRLARLYCCLRQMQIGANNALAMIQIDALTCIIMISCQNNQAFIHRQHKLTLRRGDIEASVGSSRLTVEDPPQTVDARYPAGRRSDHGQIPEALGRNRGKSLAHDA
jgi:hypothetical protein